MSTQLLPLKANYNLLTSFRVYHACATTDGFYIHSQVDAEVVVVNHIGSLPLNSEDLEGGVRT